MLDVKIKIIDKSIETVIPSYAKEGDAGLDLYATDQTCDNDGNVVYNTNLAIEIPVGYVGLIFPRSSISKVDLSLSNAVGVIDSGYRGEILFKFKPSNSFYSFPEDEGYSFTKSITRSIPSKYNVGDKIGQLIILPFPKVNLIQAEKLSDSERGLGGFGSTGK